MNLKNIDPVIKAAMKLQRKVPDAVKASLYKDNLGGPAVAMQLNEDCMMYGLYEALLYVEGYEKTQHYVAGAAERAFQAFTDALVNLYKKAGL